MKGHVKDDIDIVKVLKTFVIGNCRFSPFSISLNVSVLYLNLNIIHKLIVTFTPLSILNVDTSMLPFYIDE